MVAFHFVVSSFELILSSTKIAYRIHLKDSLMLEVFSKSVKDRSGVLFISLKKVDRNLAAKENELLNTSCWRLKISLSKITNTSPLTKLCKCLTNVFNTYTN